MKKLFLFLSFFSFCFLGVAQVQVPQPSPFAHVEQKIGLTDIVLEYSRPSMRGREIFGDLVPYDQKWRTGANANTTINFSDDVTINGEDLSKGKYAIYTIPGREQWEVIFYKDTDNWGVPQEWDDSKVALTTTAEVVELPMEMKTFTVMTGELRSDSASLNFAWENTLASIQIGVPTEEKAMSSIERVMQGPGPGDYFAAASYYHDQQKDLEQAYEWIKKAAEMADSDAYWLWRRKSLIEADLGKKKEAIESAKKSLAAAEYAGDRAYVKMNKESLEEWGASE